MTTSVVEIQPPLPADVVVEERRLLDRVGFWSLIVLALALPFELTQRPLLRTGFVTLTNLKLVFYLVTVLSLVSLVRASLTAPDAVKRTISARRVPLVLFVALLLSAAISSLLSQHAGTGLKWTADLALGGLLWLVMPLWLSHDRQVRQLQAALVVGAAVAAVIGILEVALGMRFADSLTWFKAKPTVVGPYLRLSGPFEYANIAAMYFELMLPLALVGIAWSWQRRQRNILFWVVALNLLLVALLLTYSRGALLGLLAGLATMLVAVRRHQPLQVMWQTGRWLLAIEAALAIVLGIAILSSQVAWLRLTSENDQAWYTATFQSKLPNAVRAAQIVTVPVTVINHSPFTWTTRGAYAFHLSYHWLYPSGQVAIFEGKRSLLPGDIPPGTGRTIRAALQAPPSAGRYLLVWDIVQERVLWFSLKSGRFQSVTVQVRNPPANEQTVISQQRPALSSPEPAETLQALSPPGRGQLWAAALRMVSTHPLFGVGPDGFRLSYGAYSRPKQAQWDQRIFANNLVLELVADLGLVGGGLFMAFLLTAIWPLLVAAWQGQLVLWQVGVAGAMIAFLGHGLVDYILGAHAIFILFWLLCGLAAVRTAR